MGLTIKVAVTYTNGEQETAVITVSHLIKESIIQHIEKYITSRKVQSVQIIDKEEGL